MTATPFDLGTADNDCGCLEALNDVAERLLSLCSHHSQGSDGKWCFLLRKTDEKMSSAFMEVINNITSKGIWQELGMQLKALPTPTPVPHSPSRPVSAVEADDISSIRVIALQAAS